MLETVAAGLILAAVSGITYLAYKHPAAFRKLLVVIIPSLVIAQMMIVAWALGVSKALTTVYPLLDHSKFSEADAAIESIMPRWWLTTVIFLCSYIYLGFLITLPLLIHEHKEAEPDHERPEEKD